MIDVTIHDGNPAVNIKCYSGFFDAEPTPKMDSRFNDQWIQDNLSDEDLNSWWNLTAETEVDWLIEEGETLFDDIDYTVEVMQTGRSGGWLEVEGLPEPEDWDRDLISTWKQFEEMCENTVLAFPATLLEAVYANVWTGKLTIQREHQNAIQAIWDEVQTYLQGIFHAKVSLNAIRKECPLLVAKIEGKD